MAPSARATTTADRLEGAVALDLAVAEVRDVAAWLREVRLEGELAGFSPWPGQDLMVLVPPGGDAPRWRRYTVRRFDPDAGWVDLWVTTECDGPGAAWARSAQIADRVDVVGPRGKIARDERASTHLFVVDASGLAAMCAMAEALEPPATVASLCLLPPTTGVEGSDAVMPVMADEVLTRHHVAEAADPAWGAQVLAVTVPTLELATTAAYVFGERGLVRDTAAQLAALGLDPDRVAAKAYWRADRANEEHGEPDRA